MQADSCNHIGSGTLGLAQTAQTPEAANLTTTPPRPGYSPGQHDGRRSPPPTRPAGAPVKSQFKALKRLSATHIHGSFWRRFRGLARKSGAIGLTRGTGAGYIQVICYLPLWGGNEGPRGPSFLLEVICGPFRCVRGRRLPLRRGRQALLPHPEAGVAPSGRHGGQPAHSAPGTEGLQPPSAPNLLVRRGEEWHPDQGAAADSRAPEREAPARPAQYKEPAERR